jgi:pilus assembly protein FimV
MVQGELMTRIILRLVKGAIWGALLSPATLFALGLGDIHPNSALSQPFDAEIELVSPTADELGTLKVSLAGSDIFARFGVDRPAYLSNFIFKVVPTGNGRAVVRVSSTRAVTEPVVTILVEANWAGGRTVHEYTVFLDPPVFVPVQPAPSTSVAREESRPATTPTEQSRATGPIERAPEPTSLVPPPTSEAQPAAATPVTPPPTQVEPTAQAEPKPAEQVTTSPVEPAAVPAPAQSIAAPPQPAASIANENYEVQKRDSLWRIANRIRPGTPQMINQTMVALYRANPSAFVSNNINRLRAGVVLRVPSDEQLLSVDVKEANAEVTRQYNEWRTQVAPPATEAERLRLVTPTEPAALPAADTKAAKQAEEAAAKAAADKAKADAQAKAKADADAKAQADAEAKRLLELKNSELARMQREREGQAAAEAEAARKAAEAQKAAQAAKTAEPAAPPAQQPPVAEAQPKPAPKATPKPATAPAPEPSFFDQLGDLPWTAILIGVAVLLIGGGWIVFSRRRQSTPMQFPMPDVGGVPTMTPADFEAAMDRGSARAEPDHSAFEDPRTMQVEALSEEEEEPKPQRAAEKTAELPRTAARSADDTMSSETAVHVDQQDAMAEADFHMAYGLYDQAADLVKIAIQREPNRRDLKFKLLEIFFVWGNKDSFLEAARELYQTRDTAPAGEWDRILVMGKQIAPENPMFKGGARSISDMIDVNLEGGENRVDIDLFAAPDSTGESPSNLDFEVGNTGSRSKPSKLDFLLDETANRKPATDLDDTREMDANARTQETPTIESPALDATAERPMERTAERPMPRSGEQTIRERTVSLNFDKDDNLAPASDQTAELSIDDLGLEVGEITGSLDQTTALRDADQIGDDELTRIAKVPPPPQKPRPSSLEPTMEVPAINEQAAKRSGNGAQDESEDLSISTIYLEQMDGETGTTEKEGDSTHMLGPDDLDVDLSKLGEESRAADEDTIRRKARIRVADESTAEMPSHRSSADLSPTVEHPRPKIDRAELVATTQLPEMEPVTMSEVGTKLDLARAYMDMGDPDGARSILEEVLGEGNSGQRAEAQRLLDSIR